MMAATVLAVARLATVRVGTRPHLVCAASTLRAGSVFAGHAAPVATSVATTPTRTASCHPRLHTTLAPAPFADTKPWHPTGLPMDADARTSAAGPPQARATGTPAGMGAWQPRVQLQRSRTGVAEVAWGVHGRGRGMCTVSAYGGIEKPDDVTGGWRCLLCVCYRLAAAATSTSAAAAVFAPVMGHARGLRRTAAVALV